MTRSFSRSDSAASLATVRQCLEMECEKRGLGKHIVQYYGLISARTGYGVEDFISKVFRYWSQHGSCRRRAHAFERSILLLCSKAVFIFSAEPMPARRVSSTVFSILICVTSTHWIVSNAQLSPIFPVRFVSSSKTTSVKLTSSRHDDECSSFPDSITYGKESISSR